jgi:hypothetical protein
MHHLVHQVCGGRRMHISGCTSKVPTRFLYPAVPTSHYPPTCPPMGAARNTAPNLATLTDPAWLDRTRKGVGAEPGAAGSPLAMLALRGPIGVRRGPTVRR